LKEQPLGTRLSSTYDQLGCNVRHVQNKATDESATQMIRRLHLGTLKYLILVILLLVYLIILKIATGVSHRLAVVIGTISSIVRGGFVGLIIAAILWTMIFVMVWIQRKLAATGLAQIVYEFGCDIMMVLHYNLSRFCLTAPCFGALHWDQLQFRNSILPDLIVTFPNLFSFVRRRLLRKRSENEIRLHGNDLRHTMDTPTLTADYFVGRDANGQRDLHIAPYNNILEGLQNQHRMFLLNSVPDVTDVNFQDDVKLWQKRLDETMNKNNMDRVLDVTNHGEESSFTVSYPVINEPCLRFILQNLFNRCQLYSSTNDEFLSGFTMKFVRLHRPTISSVLAATANNLTDIHSNICVRRKGVDIKVDDAMMGTIFTKFAMRNVVNATITNTHHDFNPMSFAMTSEMVVLSFLVCSGHKIPALNQFEFVRSKEPERIHNSSLFGLSCTLDFQDCNVELKPSQSSFH